MTFSQIKYDTADYWQVVRMREIELRLPFSLRFGIEELRLEQSEWIFALQNEKKLIASCQYIIENGKAKMRQVATKKSEQGKGYGKELFYYSQNILLKNNIREIYCHARATAIPFYLHLGFEIYSEEFIEVGIPHVKMRKTIGSPTE